MGNWAHGRPAVGRPWALELVLYEGGSGVLAQSRGLVGERAHEGRGGVAG